MFKMINCSYDVLMMMCVCKGSRIRVSWQATRVAARDTEG